MPRLKVAIKSAGSLLRESGRRKSRTPALSSSTPRERVFCPGYRPVSFKQRPLDIFFPDYPVALIRFQQKENREMKAHKGAQFSYPIPKQENLAVFRVPRVFSKYDIENYLTNIYHLRIKEVRTEIVVERDIDRSRGREVPSVAQMWKRAFVILQDPVDIKLEPRLTIAEATRLRKENYQEAQEAMQKQMENMGLDEEEAKDARKKKL